MKALDGKKRPVHSPVAVTIHSETQQTNKRINSGVGMAKQEKREHRDTKTTLPYRRVSEATQHYAETRDPEQAITML